MPHCVFCQNDFIDGIEVCSDCGRILTAGPLPEPVEPEVRDIGWVKVKDCENDFEAEMLKQLFTEMEIPVLKKGVWRGSYAVTGATLNMPGEQVTLWVPEDRTGIALRLLRDRTNAGRSLDKQASKAPRRKRITLAQLRKRRSGTE